MKKRHLFFILVSILLSLISKSQEIGFPIIRNYTPKEYNGTPQVLSAIQDSRGVMYFGCGSSLLEYDGVNWRNISNNKQTRFLDFAADKSGIFKLMLRVSCVRKLTSRGNTFE